MDDYLKKNRRSGLERRIDKLSVSSDRRNGYEQRDLIRQQHVFISKLKKTPMFQDMPEALFLEILNICVKKTYSKGDIICREGDECNEMYIVIDGILQVLIGGKELNLLTPIGFVGELGVISGTPCSETIVAKSESTLLKIDREELFSLFENDKELYTKFLFGILIDVSSKMRVLNDVIRKMKIKLRY